MADDDAQSPRPEPETHWKPRVPSERLEHWTQINHMGRPQRDRNFPDYPMALPKHGTNSDRKILMPIPMPIPDSRLKPKPGGAPGADAAGDETGFEAGAWNAAAGEAPLESLTLI
ncbi:GL21604 [Drosophila persimilis]|uniref:GL21604 n=1 Tax=Drosophila persimilis TaxID=7234 RepID=B4GFM0_DROPE|nr:GL21604 [Drosophila persimilis]